MKKISIFLCLLWMGFIFYMSSNNGTISHWQSTKVVNIIEEAQTKLQDKTENITEVKKTQENKNITAIKNTTENNLDHIVRKNAHAFMYMVLSFLVSSAFFAYNKKGQNVVVYILFICLFYAVTDEFHQSFISGRTSLVSDVLVDFVGALIGLVFFYLCYYKIYMTNIIRIK